MHLVQKEYKWHDHYILHDWRKHTDFLSYERWLQIIEIIRIDRIHDHYDKWSRAALPGYTVYVQNPYKTKPYERNFDTYRNKLGIRDPNKISQGRSKKQEIEEALSVWADIETTMHKAKWGEAKLK